MSPKPNTGAPASSAASLHGLIPATIVDVLRCPICQEHLVQDADRLYCVNRHSFDRARQGYVTLRRGGRTPQNADSAAMVSAREDLLGTGLYRPIREHAGQLVRAFAPDTPTPVVADLAGGTGYYLAGILDRLRGSVGICIDLSAAALKRAARSHHNAAAIGADLRETLPLASNSVSVVTSFFGPRNAFEIQRVMSHDAIFLVVTPTAEHLAELAEPLGMLNIHGQKEERLATTLSPLKRLTREHLTYRPVISRDQAGAIVRMGPNAHHVTPSQLVARIRSLPPQVPITISVSLGLYANEDSADRVMTNE